MSSQNFWLVGGGSPNSQTQNIRGTFALQAMNIPVIYRLPFSIFTFVKERSWSRPPRLGDRVRVNCTSSSSHPAPHLKWFINGKQVKKEKILKIDPSNEKAAVNLLKIKGGQLKPIFRPILTLCGITRWSSTRTGCRRPSSGSTSRCKKTTTKTSRCKKKENGCKIKL